MLKKMLTAMLAIFTTMAVATDFEDDGEGFTNARRVVGLVLVVEFQDMKAIHTLDEVRDFFNRPGGIEGSNSSGSIRDYFYGISNGHMEYTNIVVPVIVTLPHDRAHYNRAGNSISANANVIITDALNILNEMNIDLDLSELTLNPSNGRALAFNIFYAGGSLSRILNHAGSYRGGVTLNGVEFGRYQISNMGTNKNLSARLALVVHENGHSLMGWPHSLLRNRYAEENIRAIWCIMSASYGNAFPQQVNAYFRHLPGWIDVVDITNATPGTEFSMESNSHKAFVYWRNDREGYFIEARRRVKPYNHLFPTGGLAIWHIHKDGREGHDFPRVALVQADGRNDLENRVNTGDTTDLFRLGVNTEFNSSTTPAAIYHDGTPSGISLTNISDTGAVMTFMIGKPHGPTDPLYKFYSRMGSYSTARGHFEIEVSQNLTLNRRLIINTPVAAGTTLTIRSANPSAPAVLTRGIEGDLFTVPNSATLILENIIIDGGGNGDFTETGGGTLVRVNTGGTFIMNTGAVLRNNVNTGDGGGVHVRNGATFTMNGGEISSNTANNHGGGVFATGVGSVLNMIGGKISSNRAGAEGGGVRINNGGIFTMTGGEISNNTAGSIGGGVRIATNTTTFIVQGGNIISNTAGTDGGGIHFGGASFTMQGGEISNNTAGRNSGGVRVSSGEFTMTNGKVSGNRAIETDGGGVLVTGAETIFTMTNSEISGNTAGRNSGGVHVSGSRSSMNNSKINNNTAGNDGGGLLVTGAESVFTMTNSEIIGNTAGRNSGGVRVSNGEFTMTNGKVSGNRAIETDGGGVLVTGAETIFTMTNSEISGNTAGRNSGGVHVASGSRLAMSNSKINNNTAGNDGGGLLVTGTGTIFTMTNSEISGNTAGRNSGGVHVASNGCTMTNSKIIGNTAANDGGGVLVSGEGSVFTMTSGEISGNTAGRHGGAIRRANGEVNINGGVVFGTGANIAAVVSGAHNLNAGDASAHNNAVIIAWNKPAAETPLNYTESANTHLTVLPSEGAAAVWSVHNGVLGISYRNGGNVGFIPAAAK